MTSIWGARGIPNAELVRALLDGKTLQYIEGVGKQWRDMQPCKEAIIALMTPSTNMSYRIKPEVVVQYCPIYRPFEGHNGVYVGGAMNTADAAAHEELHGNLPAEILRLEIDAETLTIVKSETLN